MDKKTKIKIVAFINGELPDAEAKEVQQLIDNDEAAQNWYKEIKKIYDRSFNTDSFAPDTEKALQSVWNKMDKSSKTIGLSKFNYKIVSLAASVVILIGLILYQQYYFKPQVMANNSGKVMLVDLPDGTKVYLNNNSKITYPLHFKKNQRDVKFYGEGFFKVQPNPEAPFKITTPKMITTVLGTSFNVRAFDTEEFCEVNVVEGKVKVEVADIPEQNVILGAGEKSELETKQNVLVKSNVQSNNFLSWKTDTLNFSKAPIPTVLSDLGKYYGFQFQNNLPGIDSMELTAQFVNQPLAEIFELLEYSLNINVDTFNNAYVFSLANETK